MIYLIDTNVFVAAKNFHYRMARFPCVWDTLVTCNQMHIIDAVVTEIQAGNDQLKEWLNNNISNLTIEPTNDLSTQGNLTNVTDWVIQRYEDGAPRNDFLKGADPLIVAKAIQLQTLNIDVKVVTLEVPTTSPSKPKIADACDHFAISYISTFDFLDELGVVFD